MVDPAASRCAVSRRWRQCHSRGQEVHLGADCELVVSCNELAQQGRHVFCQGVSTGFRLGEGTARMRGAETVDRRLRPLQTAQEEQRAPT